MNPINPSTILANAQTLIFDCDGLLIDSEPWQFEARRLTAKHFGLELSEEEFLYYWFDGNGGTRAYCEKQHLDFDSYNRMKRELYDNFLSKKIPLRPGVREFLQSVKGRYHLALCSNSTRSDLDKVISRFELEGYFQVIISGVDVRHGKPDPEIFLLAAKMTGVTPAECVVFENSHIGLMAAQSAGMRCIIIPDALGSKYRFTAADLVADGMEGLNEYLFCET